AAKAARREDASAPSAANIAHAPARDVAAPSPPPPAPKIDEPAPAMSEAQPAAPASAEPAPAPKAAPAASSSSPESTASGAFGFGVPYPFPDTEALARNIGNAIEHAGRARPARSRRRSPTKSAKWSARSAMSPNITWPIPRGRSRRRRR